jgi:hypothetical protein
MSKNLSQRWDEISGKPKGAYVFFKVPLLRMVPLMLVLTVADIILWGELPDMRLAVMSVIKIVSVYIVGVIVGNLEWTFFKNLCEKNFIKLTQIRNQYVLIYGFLMFGLTIMISQLDIPIMSVNLAVCYIIVCPLAGLMYAGLMWLMIGKGYAKYLKSES